MLVVKRIEWIILKAFIFKLNLFVLSELTKITVKEPNDFFFFLGHKQQPQHSNVMFSCEIYESVLLKPQIWTYCVHGDAVCRGYRDDV